MNARDKMLSKIRALRAKTDAAGCTEAEAMAAAQLAANLMAQYEIEESDLAEHEHRKPDLDLGVDHTTFSGRNKPKVAATCWSALEQLCRCKLVTQTIWNGHRYEVTGDRADREFFLYLFRLIHETMEREYTRYTRRQGGRVGQGAKTSFQLGMGYRVRARILELVKERDQLQANANQGRALIVVETKQQEVQRFFEQRYPKLRKGKASSFSNSNGGAFHAGQAAGNRVGLGRPIAGASQGRLS